MMESKIIEKKYKKDIVKNKKRLNIKKELLKLNSSRFNTSQQHFINKDADLSVLKHVKISSKPIEMNSTTILIDDQKSGNIVIMTEL